MTSLLEKYEKQRKRWLKVSDDYSGVKYSYKTIRREFEKLEQIKDKIRKLKKPLKDKEGREVYF